MILMLILLAALSALGVVASIAAIARDGYQAIPDRPPAYSEANASS